MLLGKYKFYTTLNEDTILPEFKGSSFRGAFGHAFRKVTCAVRQKDCHQCLLFDRCLYARTFEDKKAKDRSATSPQPYLIEPPITDQTNFPADSTFDFNLLLFGQTNEYLPYYIYALEKMGALGIGRRKNHSGPGTFYVNDVRMNGQSIYDPQVQKLSVDLSLEDLKLELPEHSQKGRIRVNIRTPLRVKHQNKLTDELPFFVLIKAALRRISMLFQEYGSGEPDIDYPGLVSRAKEVKTIISDLYWKEQKRYSGRQKNFMQFGGVLGYIEYEGFISEYLPLLDLAQKLHLGKQTTFGLGSIDYIWEPME